MQRVLRHLRDCRFGRPVAPERAHHLVHETGGPLSDGEGQPVCFPSVGAAEAFARRWLCEPLAYAARPAPVTEPAAA